MTEKKGKFFTYACIIILCVLIIYLLFTVSELKNEVDNLRLNTNNRIEALDQNINSIYHNVDEKLKEQASLLSYSTYSYGDLNLEDNSVSLNVELVPKEIREGMQIYIKLGKEKVLLEKEGEKYSGSISNDLFKNDGEPLVVMIDTGGAIKTEHLYAVQVDYLFEKYLPILTSDRLGSHNYHHQTKSLEINLDTMIYFYNMNEESDVNFEEIYLVKYENGIQKKRENITEEVSNSEDFEYENFHLSRREEHTFSGDVSDEEWIYYVEAVDSFGFIHECEIYYWNGDDAKQIEHDEGANYGEIIYDRERNILYNGRN